MDFVRHVLGSHGATKCQIEDRWIIAVVIAMAKLSNVLMQVTERNFVALANDATLQEAPKPFNAVGMNLTIGIGNLMIDDGVRHKVLDVEIATILVGNKHGIGNYSFTHKLGQ
jgi:hypothetical protein